MAIAARPRRPICLLLVATTLATGLLPPALGHAHPDGDRLHRHGHGHDHHHAGPVHGDAHHDHHHEHHRASIPSGPAFGRPATAHFHIDLGAFGLIVPTSPGPPGPGRPAPGDLAIRAAADEAIAARVDATRLVAPWSAPFAVAWVDAPTPLPPARSATPPGTSPPLCDAARHERSGVLLT